MEKNNAKEKMNAFGGLSSLEMLLRAKEIKTIDFLKKAHPYMKMFYDSKMNSEIEKTAIISISDAICSIVAETLESVGFTPEKARTLGSLVAHNMSYTMGISKLMDKYFRGEIGQTTYYSELTKRIATGIVTFIENNWKVLGLLIAGGSRAILAFIGVPPIIMDYFEVLTKWLGCIFFNERIQNVLKRKMEVFFDSQPVQNFINSALKVTGKAISTMLHAVDVVVDVAKKGIEETKHFLKRMGQVINVGYNKFKSFWKNLWSSQKTPESNPNKIRA